MLVVVLLRPACAAQVDARALISAPIDESRYVPLRGNTRPEARFWHDGGTVPDSRPMQHMMLLLKRPAERESALRQTIRALHDRVSPEYHRWLGAAAVGERFGLAPADIVAITGWLQQAGFVVNQVYPGTQIIDFSGTAGTVHRAFHTEIHFLESGGVRHIANVGDPEVPAALAPAVVGIVSLHDFRPHTNYAPRPAHGTTPAYTVVQGVDLVVPADLATIYGLDPLFAEGISGQGQTIVVIEDTNLFSTADWASFRSTFGLSNYTAPTLVQEHPQNCGNPGVVAGDEAEAQIDAEWASAAAPSAAIVVASCPTSSTFGGLIALTNLVNGASPPAIVSLSYGECEASNGAAANAAYESIYEQAVAEGTSVFVSAGDEGAASCDAANPATHEQYAVDGIAVSGLASTVYDVAVGGTDFGDTYAGSAARYWAPGNGNTYGSALSYIPEIPWNDSCASSLFVSSNGSGTSYGATGFCNSPTGADYLTIVSGSGGPSGCATGTATTPGIVSGSCKGYAKPAWQSLTGNPADGVRDLPDVSLFAGNGYWNHYYVYCDSDTGDPVIAGASCAGTPNTWSGGGGTSFGAPILAGFQALVNQKLAGAQGNPNTVYYVLAASQAASGLNCNSSNGNATAPGCVFYDVTLGDIDVDCQGPVDCYDPSGTYGVLSTSQGAYAKAYGAGPGWDFATGIGSINAYNLVKYWNSADISLSGGGALTAGGLVSFAWTVGNAGPQGATGIVLSAVLPAGFTLVTAGSSSGCSQTSQTVKCMVASLAAGATARVTVLVQPAGTAAAVTFTLSSNAGDLDPGNNTVVVPLGNTIVPLPPWALGALGAALVAVAGHRRSTRSVRPSFRLP